MRDPSDVERTIDPATGLIQIGWPGGMLTLRYTGILTVTKEAQDEIQNIMKEFSADCQMMLVWFVGVLNSRGAIQHHLGRSCPKRRTPHDKQPAPGRQGGICICSDSGGEGP